MSQSTDFSSPTPAVECRRGIRFAMSVFSKIHRGCSIPLPLKSSKHKSGGGALFHTILVTSRFYSGRGEWDRRLPYDLHNRGVLTNPLHVCLQLVTLPTPHIVCGTSIVQRATYTKKTKVTQNEFQKRPLKPVMNPACPLLPACNESSLSRQRMFEKKFAALFYYTA